MKHLARPLATPRTVDQLILQALPAARVVQFSSIWCAELEKVLAQQPQGRRLFRQLDVDSTKLDVATASGILFAPGDGRGRLR